MTRVLVVFGSLDRGGAETWMLQTLRHARNKGLQIDFLVHKDGPYHYGAEVQELGAKIIPCGPVNFPPLYAWNLLRILRTHGPYQVLHTHVHHFSGLPLLVAAAARVPVRIVQSHLDTRQEDATAGLLRRVYAGAMKRLIWTCATSGIAVSSHAADALFPAHWRCAHKWRVMLLGIDLEPFSQPLDGAALRKELGIPQDATVVGHVGRFDPQKNHAFLLRVAEQYLRTSPETVFLLAGDGPLRSQIEQQARALGIAQQLRFAGVRKDVPALMQGVMDVLLLPSLFEGLPLVALEAQAAGVPCLISDGIAKETDVIAGLVHRESLAASAAQWSARLQGVLQAQAPAVSPTERAPLDISRSVNELMECYAVPSGHESVGHRAMRSAEPL